MFFSIEVGDEGQLTFTSNDRGDIGKWKRQIAVRSPEKMGEEDIVGRSQKKSQSTLLAVVPPKGLPSSETLDHWTQPLKTTVRRAESPCCCLCRGRQRQGMLLVHLR